MPRTMEELTSLPGVGRKSANVIRWHCWGFPGIIVDTHFGRVCRRLGLTAARDPAKVEREIEAIVSPDLRGFISMALNFHGRRYCEARRPRCGDCPLRPHCPRIGVEPAPDGGYRTAPGAG